MTEVDLDKKLEEYTKVLEKNTILLSRLEVLLAEKFKEQRPLISWYIKHRFTFTHPALPSYSSAGGPILGYDSETNELILYHIDKGFIRLNMKSKEERNTTLQHLVLEGHFKAAMEGFDHLNVMLDKYKSILEEENKKLESQVRFYDMKE